MLFHIHYDVHKLTLNAPRSPLLIQLREEWAGELNVRHQYLDSSFVMSDKNFCEAERICELASEKVLRDKCHGGLHHSIKIFNPGPESSKESGSERMKEICSI